MLCDESAQPMQAWQFSLDSAPVDYKEKGLPRTLAIANRLVDEIGDIQVAGIRHSPHLVAAQTAQAFQAIFRRRGRALFPSNDDKSLDPDHGSVTAFVKELREQVADGGIKPGSVLIVVGHQPMLTAIARDLASGLPAEALPLGGSEVACFELAQDGRATLLWLLTEKDDRLMEDLKDKVKSKYDVAKFFLGAFVVNTGFVLSGRIWDVSSPLARGLVALGFLLVLIGLGLTAATLMSYDRLLMPPEFWTSARAKLAADVQGPRPQGWTVLRPPSQAQVVVFYEMVHVWNAFFVPALACAFGALGCFLVALGFDTFLSALAAPGGRWFPAAGILALVTLIAAGALVLPLAVHYRPRRPDLGFED